MALLLVQLGPQTAQVLRIVRLLVAFTSLALAGPLIVIEPLSVLLLPALNVPGGLGEMLVGMVIGWLAGSGRTRSEAVVWQRAVSEIFQTNVLVQWSLYTYHD